MTNRIEATLRRVAVDLSATRRPWALVGGLAVSARAEPRTTRDVDVAVSAADDSDAEGLIFALQSRGYTVMATVEQTRTGRLATARLRPPMERPRGTVVDLLFASSGIEAEVASAAEMLEVLPGLTIPVAALGDLVALKILARDDRERPQDADDIRALLAQAGAADVDHSRASLALIEQRGYNRTRDLTRALDELLADQTRRP